MTKILKETPEQLNFKRTINITKDQKNSTKNSFWILAWYGKSYYCRRKKRLFKKVYLINATDKTYDIERWNKRRMVEAEIPEEKSILFPLGSIFNSNGLLVEIPNGSNNNKLQIIKELEIHQTKDYNSNKLFNHLTSTKYPIFNNKDFDEVYKGASYYLGKTNDSIEVIIPIHVINAYFFYLSTACTYHIIYNTIEQGIQKPKNIEEIPIVPYLGNIIRYNEAKELAKYFFLKDNDTHPFIKVANRFFEKAINNDKKNQPHPPYFGYFNSKIPFKGITSLNVLGQFINQEKTKLIVYRILDGFPINNKKKVFTTDKYLMLNLNDTRSIDVESPKQIINHTSINEIYNNIKQLSMNQENANHNLSIVDVNLDSDINTFSLCPDSELLDKNHQEYVYQIDNYFNKYIEELSDDYRNHHSASNSARANLFMNTLNYDFKIFREALNKLSKKDSFIVNRLLINSHDGLYSNSPNQEYSSLLLGSIIYNDQHYCIIDSSNSRIGILRYNNSKLSFKRKNDPILLDVIEKLSGVNKFNWSKAKKQNLLKNINIHILPPLNHSFKDESFEEASKRLLNKIESRILNDSCHK